MEVTINIDDQHKERVEKAFKSSFPSIKAGIESFVIGIVARYEQSAKQAEIKQEPDPEIIVKE